MKKSLSAVLAAALMAASLTGCGKASSTADSLIKQTTTEAETTTEAVETTTEADTSEEDEQTLYNDYIEINNYMLNRLSDSLSRYFNYVEFKEEFAPFDEDYDCYSLSDSFTEDLEEAYELASAKTEKNALDNAYLAMYPSVTELDKVLDEIYTYTDMKSYLDDDYAKGKEQHARLWAAYNEYETTGNEFLNQLTLVSEEKNASEMEKLKEEGYVVTYALNSVMNSAQALQSELYEEGITNDNIIEMDLEKIQPLYDKFLEDVEAVLQYTSDESALEKEGLPVNSAYWSSFISSMKDTKKSFTELLQHAKTQEPLSESDTLIDSITGNANLGSFDAGITGMISDYNRMLSY